MRGQSIPHGTDASAGHLPLPEPVAVPGGVFEKPHPVHAQFGAGVPVGPQAWPREQDEDRYCDLLQAAEFVMQWPWHNSHSLFSACAPPVPCSVERSTTPSRSEALYPVGRLLASRPVALNVGIFALPPRAEVKCVSIEVVFERKSRV